MFRQSCCCASHGSLEDKAEGGGRVSGGRRFVSTCTDAEDDDGRLCTQSDTSSDALRVLGLYRACCAYTPLFLLPLYTFPGFSLSSPVQLSF